ncbi:MAG: hypothetical protein CSA18_03880 [Deltaproteobacteria bacterium]|nr:MAG: hypothetical protein CSB21_00490 [Deltaproteobacteria bacterium]PIE74698.1 MAG: hypothetical protein CSA18_03880 [Deltaproteobacteria bacterium]
MKNLPIGISTFEEIVRDNYIYVDKTEYVFKLINRGKYYFLSRPRRFGKSLFLSTLKSIFQGDKELFKGLYIYDKYDFETYPVIHINFNDNLGESANLEKSILMNFNRCEKELKISCANKDYLPAYFEELIQKAYEKTGKKVVVLIDEYDKPITDQINNTDKMNKHRDLLRNIYSVIKGSDYYIRFCFLTGVTKFSRVSIFSGLNNLTDISLIPDFDAVCGYSHEELYRDFEDYLKGVDREKLAYWYDGYNFYGENVYNPFDILLFFNSGNLYRNYWFETSTPTFLIKLIQKRQYYLPKLENLEVNERLLNSFDIENINIETLLFQSGYLTIKKITEDYKGYTYILDFPNFEVRNSFNEYIFSQISNLENIDYQDHTRQAFLDCNMELLKENLYRLFASIPYRERKIHTYEGYYANIIFTHFKTIGLDINCEERTNKGRIDLVVHTKDYVFLIEFKVGLKNALEQIKSKGYDEKYRGKKIIMLGINLDETERNISSFEWEEKVLIND